MRAKSSAEFVFAFPVKDNRGVVHIVILGRRLRLRWLRFIFDMLLIVDLKLKQSPGKRHYLSRRPLGGTLQTCPEPNILLCLIKSQGRMCGSSYQRTSLRGLVD